MSETILAAVIGVVGAIIGGTIASFATLYLTDRKEKKRIENIIRTMIILIENTYINNYNCISDDYESLFNDIYNINIQDINKIEFKIRNYNLNSSELREIFTNSDLTEIFLKFKNVNINILFKIDDNLKTLKKYSPKILTENFIDQLHKNKESSSKLDIIREDFKMTFKHYNSFSKDNKKFYNEILNELKEL
ncbi:hypothetical protein HMPREF9711_03125 [Myroides odoratimimus CCUG 3837]|uniref:hypothetical protein n=1 Tax=Myroides odoratimimus TaxID=76832 RepID=UPI000280ACDC|nr:hypothetical protein [Myroides odoratimimus]EKB02663.1 hypothetical protein HMPREF9711_03125 [Myroides odoratimimus CCUG 3837]